MAGALALAACGSDDSDVDRPVDSGTVVPPDDIGVGGGVPVDNLNPDIADTEYQDDNLGG